MHTFRNIRLILAVLVVAVAGGIMAAIFLRGTKSTASPPAHVSQPTPPNIDVSLNNAHFTEMREGTVVWEVVAGRADYDKSGEKAYLSGIRMQIFKSRSAGSIMVTADTGEYASKSRVVKLRGHVRARTESGATFETDALEYLAARSLFRTASPVVFKHQRLEMTGRGMDLDAKLQTARFHSTIDAQVVGLQRQ